MVPGQGRRALADPAALPPARHRVRAAATGSAPASGSSSPARWCRCCSAASTTTRGTPTGWSGRCSPRSTRASSEPWCATLAAHLGHGLEGDAAELRRNRRYSVAHPARRRCSRRTPCSGRSSSPTGARAATPTAPAARSTTTCCWQAELWRRVLAAGRRPTRPTSGTRGPSRGSRPAATGSTCPTGCRCSGTPGSRSPRSSCSRRSASTATSTSTCRSRRPRCGTRWPGSAAWWPRDEDDVRRPRRPPAARLARPRRPRAAPHPRDRRLPDGDTAAPGSRARHPARLAPARPARQPRPDRRRARRAGTTPTATGASRCTPATARPARSTCSARCWSGCSRTTRRSSRATSS